MHSIDSEPAAGGRLRFVFSDQVVSCRVPAGVTLGEIAARFGAVSEQRLREPIAVDVTLGAPGDGEIRCFFRCPPAPVGTALPADRFGAVGG